MKTFKEFIIEKSQEIPEPTFTVKPDEKNTDRFHIIHSERGKIGELSWDRKNHLINGHLSRNQQKIRLPELGKYGNSPLNAFKKFSETHVGQNHLYALNVGRVTPSSIPLEPSTLVNRTSARGRIVKIKQNQ